MSLRALYENEKSDGYIGIIRVNRKCVYERVFMVQKSDGEYAGRKRELLALFRFIEFGH